MTIKSFFLITLLEWVLMFFLRVFYFHGNLGSGETGYYIYFIAIAFGTLVLSRRMGTISFLEAAFIAFFWFLVYAFLDLLITASYLGTAVFKAWEMWVGYAVMMLVIFLLHKKKHVEARKHLHH